MSVELVYGAALYSKDPRVPDAEIPRGSWDIESNLSCSFKPSSDFLSF